MCVSPISLKLKDAQGSTMAVPCGKCFQCINARIQGWAARLEKEADFSKSAFFITLTYDEENVPYTPNGWQTVLKYDLQKFFKRLRKREKEKIKYYAVSEYGGITLRPHYHILLFNATVENIEKAWEHGHIHYGNLEAASVRYCLKYMEKDRIEPHPDDDRENIKAYMSKGLGKAYLNDKTLKWHRDDLYNRCYYPLPDGKKASLPRYYKEKLYTVDERKEMAKRYELKELEHLDTLNQKDVEKYIMAKWEGTKEKHNRFVRAKRKQEEKLINIKNEN
jgi:hypothetical protein